MQVYIKFLIKVFKKMIFNVIFFFRIIMFYPYSILISAIAYFQIFIFILIFSTVFVCLTSSKMISGHNYFTLNVLHFVYVISSLWIFSFILDFQHIVISTVVKKWYESKDRSELKRSDISNEISKTLR